MRRIRLVALTGLTLLGVLAASLVLRAAAPQPPVVLLTSPHEVTDAATRVAATRFADAARTMLPATRIRLPPAKETSRVDWVAGMTVDGDAAEAQVTTPEGALLWSARAAIAPDGVAAAADRLGHRTARTLTCAAGGPPAKRDEAVTALLMSFCDSMQAGGFRRDNEATLALARRLVVAAPQDAYAHGHLAATLAINAWFAPKALASPMRAAAESEANRALALDARTGEAWLARAVLSSQRRDFAGQEMALRRGLAAEQ